MNHAFKYKADTWPGNAIHISLDLETASTASNAAIVQLAAVWVDCPAHTFTSYISLMTCEAAGLHVAVDTMEWWSKQDPVLRDRVFSGTSSLHKGLCDFYGWLSELCGGDLNRVYLWGNGAEFDCAILQNATEEVGLDYPINFRHHEHLRTLKRMMPEELQYAAWRKFTARHPLAQAHDALMDATYQAYIIQEGISHVG